MGNEAAIKLAVYANEKQKEYELHGDFNDFLKSSQTTRVIYHLASIIWAKA